MHRFESLPSRLLDRFVAAFHCLEQRLLRQLSADQTERVYCGELHLTIVVVKKCREVRDGIFVTEKTAGSNRFVPDRGLVVTRLAEDCRQPG